MPLPFVIGGAVLAKAAIGVAGAAGVFGVVKGTQGAMKTVDAKNIQKSAKEILETAKKSIERQKKTTAGAIQNLGKTKVNVLANEMNTFVDEYQKIKDIELVGSSGIDELHKITLTKEELKALKNVSIGAVNTLGGLATGAGTGALLAWGTYNGVAALGTASTGTAIGTLSGVAAKNATLAWLGGGALKVGGGGMALGSVVLGSLVAGPALLVAGGLFSSKANTQLNNAKSNKVEAERIRKELSIAGQQLNVITEHSRAVKKLLETTNTMFKNNISEMVSIIERKTEWTTYTQEEKEQIAATVKLAKLVKGIIDTPLLTEDGILTAEVKQLIQK